MKAIADELFQDSSIQLLEKGVAYEAEFFALRDGFVYVLTEAPASERRVMIVERPGQKVVFDCALHQRRDGVEVLKPLSVHQMGELRASERKKTGPSLRAVNIVSVKSVFDALSFADLKRDASLAGMMRDVRKLYPYARVIFQPGPHRMDQRSRALLRTGLVIFAPRMEDPSSWNEQGIPFPDYQQILRYGKPGSAVVSEITVPLQLRGVFQYGYLQVFGEKELAQKDIQILQGIAKKITSCLERAGYLPSDPGSCQILDVSTTGLAFLYPRTAAALRDFDRGEELVLDVLHGQTGLSLHAAIRVIQSVDDSYRIGVQFKSLNHEQSSRITEILKEV
jgi:hypothetical protein